MKDSKLGYPDELKHTYVLHPWHLTDAKYTLSYCSLSTHTGPVNVVRYNNQTSKYCLTGGQDRSIRLWNSSAGKEVKVYKGHGYEVLGLDM